MKVLISLVVVEACLGEPEQNSLVMTAWQNSRALYPDDTRATELALMMRDESVGPWTGQASPGCYQKEPQGIVRHNSNCAASCYTCRHQRCAHDQNRHSTCICQHERQSNKAHACRHVLGLYRTDPGALIAFKLAASLDLCACMHMHEMLLMCTVAKRL